MPRFTGHWHVCRKIPLKFFVGIMLSSFGLFWTGEGLGVDWPGADLAIPVFMLLFLATGLILPRIVRHPAR